MDILKEIAGKQAQLVSLRRSLHEHPELSRQEFHTAERIERELDAIGLPHRRVGETGVYAELRCGDGPTVMLRADIDALPIQEENDVPYRSKNDGVMHACGHDMHTASLLVAAAVLAEHRDELHGTVRFFFQQAEEIGYGANVFIREGLLDGADFCFGIHSAPDLPVGKVGVKSGPNNASVDFFRIRVHGKAAHVSTPQLGADALYVAAQIVVGAQALVTRRTSPIDSAIIGIGKLTAGSAYNIVADEAVLEGTTRLFTPALRKQVDEQLEALAKQTAALYGATAEVEWVDYASPLVNDEAACRHVAACVTELFGADALVTERELSCGGDDFAEYINRVPGMYAYVGTASDDVPGSHGPAHNSHFNIDERALAIAASLYVQQARGLRPLGT